jgi:peptidoglycan/LPS O-acetylase OafA/YrhL
MASIVVVAHHFSLGFLPGLRGSFPRGLGGTPLFWLVNGNAAVCLFFVLSGYVLTHKFFTAERSLSEILTAALKRLPRLWPSAALSILLGYFILAHGLNENEAAAAITGSGWLKEFAYAVFPAHFQPSLADAVKQTVTVFFLPFQFYYNSNLWTMRPEFFGSLICYGFVAIAYAARGGRLVVAAVAAALFIAGCLGTLYILPFFLGMMLARHQEDLAWNVPSRVGLAALAVCLALLSSQNFFNQNAGAALAIYLCLHCQAFAGRLSGRFGRMMGTISFPLYLVHTLVITSISSAVFVAVIRSGGTFSLAVSAAAGTTMVACSIGLIPFVLLERYWLPLLSRLFENRQKRSASSGSGDRDG